MKTPVVDMKGKAAGELELNPAIWATPAYRSLVHEIVRWQRAKKRAGTHSALNRKAMEGGGRKPWKQKGTGRARAGSSNSPVWVGGAVTFGPTPRNYEFKVPRAMRKRALCGVLSQKVKKGKLIVVDSLEVTNGKTKEIVECLHNLNLAGSSALIVINGNKETKPLEFRAARNIAGVKAISADGLNVYDLLKYKYVVMTKDAVAAAEVKGAI
ncbi:MAG: 50S ribosomal protein L4 [Deltaproteobacteria bacterium]|nr:50S ribosomal protein L4 [Deltaproteobacteria bacterium]